MLASVCSVLSTFFRKLIDDLLCKYSKIGHSKKCIFVQLLFYNFEVFLMHTTDGYCITTEIEDELTVTVYADYVAFTTLEDAGEYSKLYMVFGKLLERISQKCYPFWIVFQDRHERLHHLVTYRCRLTLAPIINQMILRIIDFQEFLKFTSSALQKYKSANGWLQFFLYASLLALLPVSKRTMDKTSMD